MDYYFLLCRSLTYAQRTVAILERGGLSAYLTRVPQTVAVKGCGYGVKISKRYLERSLSLLDYHQLYPKKIFAISIDGMYQEHPMP